MRVTNGYLEGGRCGSFVDMMCVICGYDVGHLRVRYGSFVDRCGSFVDMVWFI